MKAVIVDIEDKYVVALSKTGEFIKVKNNGNYQIGYEYDLPNKQGFDRKSLIKVASIAAVFVLVFGSLGYGAYSYTMPYSYIDVDINPSIEITTNVYDRILKVEGLNDDGTRLVSTESYRNKALKDGIDGILKRALEEGYLKGDSNNALMLTVSSKDDKKGEQLEKEMQGAADQKLKAVDVDASVVVEKIPVKERDNAIKQGVSPGKLLLIDRAVKANPELKAEDLKKESVKEILKSINSVKKQEKPQKTENVKNNNTDKDDKSIKQDKTDDGKKQGQGNSKKEEKDKKEEKYKKEDNKENSKDNKSDKKPKEKENTLNDNRGNSKKDQAGSEQDTPIKAETPKQEDKSEKDDKSKGQSQNSRNASKIKDKTKDKIDDEKNTKDKSNDEKQSEKGNGKKGHQ